MITNAKELNAAPVLGFEWRGCHYRDKKDQLWKRDAMKALGCIPIGNFIAGAIFIGFGVKTLSMTPREALKNHGIDHQRAKGAAWIARGVITLIGGGVIFVLADAVMSVCRAFFRPAKPQQ